MDIENTEMEDRPLTLAGAILEQFREVRAVLAEAYGVDESVAIETALWGSVDEECETDEEWTERDIKRNPQKEVDASWRDHVKWHEYGHPYPYRYEKKPELKDVRKGLEAGGVNKLKAGRATELSAILGPERAAALYARGSKGNNNSSRNQSTHADTNGEDARDRELAANKKRASDAIKAARAAAKEKNRQLTAQHSDGVIKGHAE